MVSNGSPGRCTYNSKGQLDRMKSEMCVETNSAKQKLGVKYFGFQASFFPTPLSLGGRTMPTGGRQRTQFR